MKLHYSPRPLLGGFSALLIAALLSVCAQAQTSQTPRAPATVTLKDWSAEMPEDAHDYKCATDQALVGRWHWGAEDKDSKYRCGSIFQFKDIPITDVREFIRVKESDGIWVVCPENEVMVGRGHLGDENGDTWYYCGKIHDYWDNPMNVVPGTWQRIDDEEETNFQCASNQVLVGRYHRGDETKQTQYLCATLY